MKLKYLSATIILVIAAVIMFGCGYSLSSIREMDDVYELRTAFSDTDDSEIKYEVVRRLGYLQTREAKDALIDHMLTDSDMEVRIIAIDSLSEYDNDQDIVEAMIERLSDDSDEIVNAAIEYLSDNVLDAEQKLTEGLQDDNYKIRLGCLKALKSYTLFGLQYPPFISIVVELSKQAFENVAIVREQANKLLGDLEITHARIVLFQNKFIDENARVREAAQNALNQVLGRSDFVYEEIILAIIPLSNMTGESSVDQYCIDFADHIMQELMQEKVCRIVERAQIDRIIAQLEISDNDLYSDVNAPRIGELTQATQVIYGALQTFQNEFTITIKRTVIETGEVVQVETITGYQANLNQMRDQIANKVLRSFAMSEID